MTRLQVVTIGGKVRIALRIAADKLAYVVNNRISWMLKFVQCMIKITIPIIPIDIHTIINKV